VVGRGVPEIPGAALAATAELPEGVVIARPLRRAYFGPAHGWCHTDIINRADLRKPRAGPCIIEECDSTCVVPPGSTAQISPNRRCPYLTVSRRRLSGGARRWAIAALAA
jgi:N-methylhydantoinase A